VFEKLALLWREKNPADNGVLLSRGVDAYAKAVKEWQSAIAKTPKPGAKLVASGTVVGMPMPTVYRAIGLKPLVLSLPVRYLQGIIEKHTDLPAGVLENLPQLLSDPIVVIPYIDGGYRALIDVTTANGDPVVVGIAMDGRVQTVTPMHKEGDESGAARFAGMLEKELAKTGAKVYARNKEALVKTKASRGVAMATFNTNHASSTGAGPAISALRRDSPRQGYFKVSGPSCKE